MLAKYEKVEKIIFRKINYKKQTRYKKIKTEEWSGVEEVFLECSQYLVG